jgi:hypothetical protein
MIQKLVLDTQGYQVTFEILAIPDCTDAFNTIIHFLLDPRLEAVAFQSVRAPLTIETLQRLTTYIEQHLVKTQDEPFAESYPFVPMNLLFEVQALAGEWNAPDDMEFSLRFMVNMEQEHVDLNSIYVGGNAVITLQNINSFLASVKQLIAETPQE